jgi:three-Cys-motif partner protein
MNKLIDGDDNLPAEEVGRWAKEKHAYLCRYIDISRKARGKWSPPRAGSTYIDPFCGPGRAKIRGTNEWIDGSAVAAWKKSLEGGSPFTKIYIADHNPERLNSCATRLRILNAPVVALEGPAQNTVQQIISQLNIAGLHFAFLDPFDLGSLHFEIIKALSTFKYIDMLVHISLMDLQRNLDRYIRPDSSTLDYFVPGWRTHVSTQQNKVKIRKELVHYWREKVRQLNVWPSNKMRLITGSKSQPLYWLLLAAKHKLPQKFWESAANIAGQRSLF